MFGASSAHLQEVNDGNCTCMQPLVFSFSAGGRLVHLLRGDLKSVKELCYDARPTKSQDVSTTSGICKTVTAICRYSGKGKGKAIPLQALAGPEGFRKLRLPDFKTIST